MLEEGGAAQPSPAAVAEAAAWISRLHSARRTPEFEAGFRDWLAADEQNARAFEGMTGIWDDMPGVAAAGLDPDRGRRARPRHLLSGGLLPSRQVRVWATLAACVCCIAGLAYWLLQYPSYATGVGEQRIVNLDDGTRISLNASTRIEVKFDRVRRRIVLDRGEAFFEVARDARRVFVVLAGGSQVTALGTSFAVRYEHDRTAVTLVAGKVSVSSSESLPWAPVANKQDANTGMVLSPGQRLTLAASRPPSIDTPKIDAATAWRHGEIILDETALADAVNEMNRYDKTRLVIDDPMIASLQVSGIYRTGDSAGFADMVARMYQLTVTTKDQQIHLKGQGSSNQP